MLIHHRAVDPALQAKIKSLQDSNMDEIVKSEIMKKMENNPKVAQMTLLSEVNEAILAKMEELKVLLTNF